MSRKFVKGRPKYLTYGKREENSRRILWLEGNEDPSNIITKERRLESKRTRYVSVDEEKKTQSMEDTLLEKRYGFPMGECHPPPLEV